MIEIVVSIPHSGTRFLKERLSIDAHVHTNIFGWDALIRETKGKKLVAPLRDPQAVWKSTVRRYNKWDATDNISNFFNSWFMMHALSLIRDIEFIPVDLQISDRITDWTPVGGEEDQCNTKCYPTCLRRIYVLPFVQKYYPINRG